MMRSHIMLIKGLLMIFPCVYLGAHSQTTDSQEDIQPIVFVDGERAEFGTP